jgi:hypothetical protein
MDRLYVFLIRNDIWIYILCFLGLIWYLVEFVRARRLLRGAMFGLERERGQRMQNRAAIIVFLFLSIIAFVTFVNLQVAPTLPDNLLKPPTPTPNIFSTPLSSPFPQVAPEISPTADLAIAPTVTLANQVTRDAEDSATLPDQTPEGQPIENLLPDVEIGNCAAEINISAPPSGVSISGEVSIFGTANPEDFGYYDLEIFGPATGERWITIFDVLQREPIIDDILATVDFAGLEAGSYLLRLSVADNEGIGTGQCTIQLEVE